ncbi:MAG: VWA domain-containing protein [Polyangiaceae bacterium]
MTCDGLDASKPLVLYLSADDSNSMGSPVQAREALVQWGFAPQGIRTYEFLNYYHIDYDAPPLGELKLFAEGAAGENPGEIDLQLAVRSFDAVTPRRPMNLTFVLDTSGSMEGAPISREQAAVKAIAASLAPGDIVSMVTWNTGNNVVLDGYSVIGASDSVVTGAADKLSADGGTDLHGGLVAGYGLATKNYDPAKLNRVILISDGGANVGITDKDLIALSSEDADKEGIYLVGVGVGPADGYNDRLMDTVTDKGRGRMCISTPRRRRPGCSSIASTRRWRWRRAGCKWSSRCRGISRCRSSMGKNTRRIRRRSSRSIWRPAMR